MSFEEFRISKRGENNYSYPDWKEWLEKRLGEPVDGSWNESEHLVNIEQAKQRLEPMERSRIMRGGDNFTFICWGDATELKLWQK